MRSTDNVIITQEDSGVCTLTIQQTNYPDEGIYRCVATNKCGEDKTQGTFSKKIINSKIHFYRTHPCGSIA